MSFTDPAAGDPLGRADLVKILSATDPADIEAIRSAAERVLLENCGDGVYLRGLIEASNACACDCFYCGIRKSNRHVERYTLCEDEIVACAHQIAALGYGSMVIQSGERNDKKFVELVARAIERIKRETRSDEDPEGLGITLSLGQLSRETYQRLYAAGAHRYLLRIETTNPDLFRRLHPEDQTFESRIECLGFLREAGFQVGTGVMIGLPYQTLDDLADDILFFKEQDIDMIGMGPFIPHPETPLAGEPCPDTETRVRMSLLMIAATRLALKDVNIASTTALQALDPLGREKGLKHGANVLMPQVTPEEVRPNYLLYPGKPNLHENALEFRARLEERIEALGRKIGYHQWGDSLHARKRQEQMKA